MFKRPQMLSRHALGHISSTRSASRARDVRQTRTTSIHKERRYLERPRYAYFTLVMCGDEYAIGAAVLGWSLRKQRVQHELVVMVTPDVSIKARKLLMKIYDRVERVKYINCQTESFLNGYHQDKAWKKFCLTKACMLKYVEYDKIVWMDADMLVLENPDELFSLPTPAGICTSIRDHERWHGQRIPEQEIKESLLNNYGVNGCIMVLKPCIHHYLLSKSQQQSGHGSVYPRPDEYFFAMVYKGFWHHVNHKFGCSAVREANGIHAVALHFDHAKPWQPKLDVKWTGDNKWWEIARDLIGSHPGFQTLVPVLEGPTAISRPWIFLSSPEKVSYKLRNDYKTDNMRERKI